MVHVYSKSFRIYELLNFPVNADACGLITFTFQFSTALKNPVWELDPPPLPTFIFKNLKTKLKHERKQKKKEQELYNVYVLFLFLCVYTF